MWRLLDCYQIIRVPFNVSFIIKMTVQAYSKSLYFRVFFISRFCDIKLIRGNLY